MRSAFTVLANRAFFLLALWLILNAAVRPGGGCGYRGAALPSLESLMQGLGTLSRAMQ